LELEKCDAITMIKIAKELKSVRQKRRVAKEEFTTLQMLRDRLHCGGVNKLCDNEAVKKHYSYRTDVMKKIVGDVSNESNV
jgi:hypothetical protein